MTDGNNFTRKNSSSRPSRRMMLTSRSTPVVSVVPTCIVRCSMSTGRTKTDGSSYHWRLGRDPSSSLCRTRDYWYVAQLFRHHFQLHFTYLRTAWRNSQLRGTCYSCRNMILSRSLLTWMDRSRSQGWQQCQGHQSWRPCRCWCSGRSRFDLRQLQGRPGELLPQPVSSTQFIETSHD